MQFLHDNVRRMCRDYDDFVQQQQQKEPSRRKWRKITNGYFTQHKKDLKPQELEEKTDELVLALSEMEKVYIDSFFKFEGRIKFDEHVHPAEIKKGIEITTFGTGYASGNEDTPDKSALRTVGNSAYDGTLLNLFSSNWFVLQRCKMIADVINSHVKKSDRVVIHCKLHNLSGLDFDDIATLRLDEKYTY